VIVGVGQINDRPETDADGLNSFGLMKAALRAADLDAGGGWLARLDSLGVVAQLSFPDLGDVSRPLADALGAAPRLCRQTPYPSGDSPLLLLNEATERIAAGEIEIGAIVGGEALRTATRRAKAHASGAAPNAVREAASRGARPLRQRYGIVAPVDVYPLYENACRAAWGQSLAEAQLESAQIWSLFSQVAADNPNAWLRRPLAPADILTLSADNRPIAFPYTKLMVANASVNQGAGFIVASLAKAKAMGVRADQLISVGAGAAAREPGDILARDRFDRSSSMEAVIRNALAFNNISSNNLDCVELYSCFPCIPKLARRILDWPVDRPATVFGGLTFGGGPVGNYMSHAVAAMVLRMRAEGRYGLLFANGGFATTNHAIVLSRDPLAVGPHSFDVQAEADATRGPVPALLEDYTGPASIETYTVFYDRAGTPTFGVVIARTPRGARFICRAGGDDTETIAFLTSGEHEPVGVWGEATQDGDGANLWRCK
jgi:acetyl-CoA C-acetyltransferase